MIAVRQRLVEAMPRTKKVETVPSAEAAAAASANE
jgi:hypothetical protein